MKFYVGQRVRVKYLGDFFGKEGTIWEIDPEPLWHPAAVETGASGTAYSVDIDGIGRDHPDGVSHIAFQAHELEPIVPIGSWEETFRGVDFDIRVPA